MCVWECVWVTAMSLVEEESCVCWGCEFSSDLIIHSPEHQVVQFVSFLKMETVGRVLSRAGSDQTGLLERSFGGSEMNELEEGVGAWIGGPGRRLV